MKCLMMNKIYDYDKSVFMKNISRYFFPTVFFLITILCFFVRYALPVRDGDLWFHLVYGQYFLEHLTLIPDHTVFSWSPSSNDTIYCTWLPDIILFLIHKIFGLNGLFVFRYICLFALVFTGIFYAKKTSSLKSPLPWLVIISSMLMAYTAAFIKPEVVSFTIMTIMVWNWYDIRISKNVNVKRFYLFPFLTLIWVNSHGGFIFGIIFLVLIGLGEILNTWFSYGNTLNRDSRRHLAIALLLSFISVFITPYGYKYPLELFFDLIPNSANMSYSLKIQAYSSPFTVHTPFHSFSLYANIAVFLLIVGFLKNLKTRTVEWSSLLTNLFFAYLYTFFLRTTFFWAPVFLFTTLYLYYCGDFSSLLKKCHVLIKKSVYVIICLLVLTISINAIYNSIVNPEPFQYFGFGISEINPVEEADFIKKNYPKAKIGSTYNQGAYFLWKFWPENKVFFDARHFPYKSWSDEFLDFIHGKNIEEFIEKYPADLWCISLIRLKTCVFFIKSKNWELIFFDKNCAIFARKDFASCISPNPASSVVTKTKNITNALHILAFLCAIQDWNTAEKLLIEMNSQFKFGRPKELTEKSGHFLRGIKNYANQHYMVAYNELILVYPEPFHVEKLLVNCLLFESLKAFETGNLDDSLSLNTKVNKLYNENIFSLYNVGVLQWWKTKNFLNGPEYPLIVWQDKLKQFIINTNNSSQFHQARETAKHILNGSYVGQPYLIVPPKTFYTNN